ncbi:MAG: hypothetical protein ACXW3K_07050 [Brevundimonas sp.]
MCDGSAKDCGGGHMSDSRDGAGRRDSEEHRADHDQTEAERR